MNELRNNQHTAVDLRLCLQARVCVCVCVRQEEGGDVQTDTRETIPSLWGNILQLFQNGRHRRINGVFT